MCLGTITKRYDPPLKEVIAYGLFRIKRVTYDKISEIEMTKSIDEEGIFSEYEHPYKGTYQYGRRYKAKDVPRGRIIIGNEGRLVYKVGFHKWKDVFYMPVVEDWVTIMVKLENVRLLGKTDCSNRMVYVADYMTLLKEVK